MIPTILDIEDKISEFKNKNLKKYNISILRDITIENLSEYLKYIGFEHNINCEAFFNDLDTTFVDAISGNTNLFNDKTDCVIIMHYLDKMSWDLARRFSSLSKEQADSECQRLISFFQQVVAGIKKQTTAQILITSFASPRNPAFGSIDYQMENGQSQCINQLNLHLKDLSQANNSVHIIETDRIVRKIGEENFFDDRYWHIGQAPYSKAALFNFSAAAFRFIRPTLGQNRKCLVLDCDNTLWGGIIGEDGLSGINLSRNYPGSTYYEFQQGILNLYDRGIILALCSKNNEKDVWEVFSKHPDMLLKKKHIASAMINWNDKASNIRQLAQTLNIGLDSMVFMDDSDFEINLVRTSIPEVHCIQVDKNSPEKHLQKLMDCDLFDINSFSQEDAQRGAMYKANAKRKELKSNSGGLKEYYHLLEMCINIQLCDEISIPRVAQQTQKTNQFNLTTKRYTEGDINAFVQSLNYDVITLKLDDKFGPSGIVGTAILYYTAERAIIDSFLLSCRVLGRGIEEIFINIAMQRAQHKGCSEIIGLYRKTAKNVQVENFYGKTGFTLLDEPLNKSTKSFSFNLDGDLPEPPDYFKEINIYME
ncbi:HAD-IIIC family phosphatase [Maridesulfovibrio hydrothermalis]|uniref:FkbH domain protein n=1 Tax=Maridesulfovibrio hydrothermalis AM13 = DSM 14728 TaxID=1121451 RepID=L0RAJ4_9BACT|nr:HAD-IIIC family phosphatase [Maridesulfovibrio hydrothermalis]CCO23210.1 FkbH domain protein [Maridesulfovibrio hydrothermalis AM13 = DSM 14728]